MGFIFVESTHHIHEHVAGHLIDFWMAKSRHPCFRLRIILSRKKISIFYTICDLIRNVQAFFYKVEILFSLMLDGATSPGILLLILLYLMQSLLNYVVVNFLFGFKNWQVPGRFGFLFWSLRYLLIWLESSGHNFNLRSRGIWNIVVRKDSYISCWSTVGFGQNCRLHWIEIYLLCTGVVFCSSQDLFEPISTLSQNWLVVNEGVRLDLEVAFVVCVGSIYLLSVLRSRFEASYRLISRSLRPIMNLIRILEVSIFEHFVHLGAILTMSFVVSVA